MSIPTPELVTSFETDSSGRNAGTLDETAVPSRLRVVLRRFVRQRTAVIGFALLIVLVFMAFVGIHFGKWTYTEHDFESFQSSPNGSHWFGTDATGQDMFASTMRGAQKSIIIGLLVAVLATGIAAFV